jgi:protein-S-isoprenylcysteine O-methyltransferase Ste14
MSEERTQKRTINPRMVISVIVFFLYTPLVLFITSGQLDWWMAWVYSAVSVLLSIGSRVLMARKNPDLVAERASFREAEGVKEWDKKLVPLVAQVGPFIMLVTVGLDKRFGWTETLPLWFSLVAFGIAMLGFLFSTWALIENRYFSSVVRIQTERGHTVCSTGPYRYVRHPGYAGSIVWFLMTPLILSSLWTYVPTAFVIALLVLRTSLEDKTLQAELPGYNEYTRQTHFRLVPMIW